MQTLRQRLQGCQYLLRRYPVAAQVNGEGPVGAHEQFVDPQEPLLDRCVLLDDVAQREHDVPAALIGYEADKYDDEQQQPKPQVSGRAVGDHGSGGERSKLSVRASAVSPIPYSG